jgi:hypothetical protein
MEATRDLQNGGATSFCGVEFLGELIISVSICSQTHARARKYWLSRA